MIGKVSPGSISRPAHQGLRIRAAKAAIPPRKIQSQIIARTFLWRKIAVV